MDPLPLLPQSAGACLRVGAVSVFRMRHFSTISINFLITPHAHLLTNIYSDEDVTDVAFKYNKLKYHINITGVVNLFLGWVDSLRIRDHLVLRYLKTVKILRCFEVNVNHKAENRLYVRSKNLEKRQSLPNIVYCSLWKS